MVNHQSTADIPMTMTALYPKGLVIGQVMWIMDYIFMYTNFGWASYYHLDFFIQQVKYTCKAPKKQTTKLRPQISKNFLNKLHYVGKSKTRGQTLYEGVSKSSCTNAISF